MPESYDEGQAFHGWKVRLDTSCWNIAGFSIWDLGIATDDAVEQLYRLGYSPDSAVRSLLARSAPTS